MYILEDPQVLVYLKKRNLINQYKKARENFENGEFNRINFKRENLKQMRFINFELIKNTEPLVFLS